MRRGLALTLTAVTVGALLSACGRPLAQQPTVVARAAHAEVLSGRTMLPAVPGMHLGAGDVLRLEPGGSALLSTAGRDVYVTGAGAAVAVLDGARQQLRAGSLVVDARHGPGLTVAAAGFTVRAAAGSAVRVDRGYTVRVGTYSGKPAEVSSVGGRTLAVPRWWQVVSAGDALPGRTTPLHLLDDAPEQAVARPLVSDDLLLDARANGLTGDPADATRLETAAFRTGPAALPAATPASESLLAFAIARAGGRPVTTVDGLRREGGSWAVVARICGSDAAGALRVLALLQPGGSTGASGAGGVAGPGGAVLAGPAAAGGGLGPGSGPGGPGSGPAPVTGPGGQPSPGTSPAPSPSPSPSPSPTPDPVTQVVDTVVGLLPSPSPSASSTPQLQLPGLSVSGSGVQLGG